MEKIISVDHLAYSYPGVDSTPGVTVFEDLNLEIEAGTFVAVLGSNGCGKSTLAKLIAGIYQPTSGQILLDGEDITDLSITDRARRGISFAFQQPVRFKGITVKDLISHSLEVKVVRV